MSAVRDVMTFSGRVQGVGFRYTTCRVARRFAVTGWVRNEPNGTVRCEVEGEPAELDRFAAAMHDAMEGYISDTHIARGAASGEFSRFEIRR